MKRSLHDPDLSPAEIRELVQLGHDINERGMTGMTVLQSAVAAQNPATVKAVLEAGADVDSTYSRTNHFKDGTSNVYVGSALQDACSGSSPEIVSLLIKAGANVDKHADKTETTPLMVAALCGRAENIHLLLEAGAKVNVRNKAGFTALHCAVRGLTASGLPDEQSTKAVEAMVRAGADVTAKDGRGNTPLHCAIDSPSVAALLIKAGANLLAKNADGKTPIDLAREQEGRALELLQSVPRHGELSKQWDRHAPNPAPARTPKARGRDRW